MKCSCDGDMPTIVAISESVHYSIWPHFQLFFLAFDNFQLDNFALPVTVHRLTRFLCIVVDTVQVRNVFFSSKICIIKYLIRPIYIRISLKSPSGQVFRKLLRKLFFFSVFSIRFSTVITIVQ